MQSDFTYVGQKWAQMHKLITDSILYPPLLKFTGMRKG